MESSEYRQQTRSMKTKLRTSKLQDEDIDFCDRVDSGYGDSLVSIPSDRSNTNSYSIDDESRNQECSESMELTRKTAQIDINSDQFHQSDGEKCHSIGDDQGYKSYSEPADRRFQPRKVSWQENVLPFECVRLFSQTEDVRYLLAPFWPMLLHRNDDGDTSLHLGVINCKEQTVLQMIDVLPTPQCFDIYNDLTQTPLHLAAITRQHKIVGKLIDRGASVDLVDRNGQTCVHLACQRGDLKTLNAIFKRRPGQFGLQKKLQEVLEMKNFDGLTPLCVAVKANHIEVVKKLILTHHADVEAIDNKSGNTALHLAVEDNNLPMVSCLLFKGNANPNAMSYSSNTPLHIAAGLGSETIVATLIAMGASGSIENMEGDTAFRIESESSEDITEEEMEN